MLLHMARGSRTRTEGRPRPAGESWWSQRGNRYKLWLTLIAVGGAVVIGLSLLIRSDAGDPAPYSQSSFPSLYTFGTADMHALTFDPTKSGRLLFGHHGGVKSSEDGGGTWSDLRSEKDFDGMNLVFDPGRPSTLYLAGHNAFSASTDGGRTWQSVQNNLPGLDLHAFGASMRTGGRLFAFAVGRGLFVSESGASSWTLLTDGAPQGTHSIVEVQGGALLLGSVDQGVLRSDDGGATWSQSGNGLDGATVFSVKADAAASRIYAGTSRGLLVSTDDGRTWSPTALNDTLIVSVAVNPQNASDVMAIGRAGELFGSSDGGNTWLASPKS